MKTLKEKSTPGRTGVMPPQQTVDTQENIPQRFLRKNMFLPELSETDVVRHYTALSRLNYGVDTGFYPLGSCTMKYNPKINEDIARMEGFTSSHPLSPQDNCQGSLEVMYELQEMLAEITGMDAFTLQPSAGAHGELTGIMIVKAYYKDRGEERKKIIVPDSSHGTNPATAGYCGYEVAVIKSDEEGDVDLGELKAAMSEDVACLMLTNPNTLGLFDKNICEITKIVHGKGGLVYYDGANMNAIVGKARPGDMGYDIVHINLHKTFSTPHGGGGPGSGPVGVKKHLRDYLPSPIVSKNGEKYSLDYNLPHSIGQVRAFYGSFGVILRAYAYILALGAQGLEDVSEQAVLNANYLKEKLKEFFDLPFDRVCMHEFVLSGRRQAHMNGVHTLNIAKRLLDYGVHAPTIYFPMIVEEAIMIEPTETESKTTLDEFIEAMKKIATECNETPDIVKSAPHNTPVKKLDDTLAARKPSLTWNMTR
ncbi:MAG: aminomethyl-transferring glycine dehydrogenase subunit GcvPB [Candidatus Altiarchaeota archaeon]|nr:aminomethyl-transferring glycine dehydrogenase subunit GcvPB [Candidatus Altiarchaeota archaeon]